jgi:hypothetical protein
MYTTSHMIRSVRAIGDDGWPTLILNPCHPVPLAIPPDCSVALTVNGRRRDAAEVVRHLDYGKKHVRATVQQDDLGRLVSVDLHETTPA